MSDEEPDRAPEIRVSDAERQAVVDRLRHASGEGRITLPEFDERVKVAYAATTNSQLEPLTADLPRVSGGRVDLGKGASVQSSSTTDAANTVSWTIAVMSGNERRGRWPMARSTTSVAVMGGCVLDLRDATLPRGEVTITAVAVMGGIEIYLPEGVDVHVSGLSLMGGRDVKIADTPRPPDFPVVHVRAFAVMGGVSVRTKRPGSGKDLYHS